MKLNKAMERLWPQTTYPLSFADALGTLSKQQLTSIRTNLRISNLSSLNKQGLVEKLSEKIPEHLSEVINCFDNSRYKLLLKIVKNDGMWDKPLLEFQQYEYFLERGILFRGTLEGKHVVCMPAELVAYFKETALLQEHSNVSRNTEWIRLTQGLMLYYGVLTMDELQAFIITETDDEFVGRAFIDILFDAQNYYDTFTIGEEQLVSSVICEDPDGIMKERSLRNDLDFCPFTKQQLLKAGEPEYVERTTPYMNLVRFVLHRYEIDREDADLLAQSCVDAAKNGSSLAEVIGVAKDFIEIPNLETANAITNLMVALMNSTKQWAIKGYSPEELSAKRTSASLLLNQVPSQTAKADVIDLQTRKKIGRNDPCSCGSGKKFKKCCG
ncbi:YecA family protein [Paenibacillus sinopodophylli]|uniref:YecA family protein n=1 Tax=Paenibacillus sinopodophylli TaxID=1837342 RepID=UPI001486FA60|nr:SEC-C metal-binding domain-containing protein [Paenibacillus sinopodophylli]